MCGGNDTTTQNSTSASTTSPQGYVQRGLQSLFNNVQGLQTQQYDPATGKTIAGFTPAQIQAQNAIEGAQGVQNSYLNQAQQTLNANAQPISPSQIQNYENPYTQKVIDATQKQFDQNNAHQQSEVTGNAALAGALGGNRLGVAQALTAQAQQTAQAPVIAQLQNQGYTQALQAAQQQQSVGLRAAGQEQGLGSQAQNAAYTDAGALAQSGAQQQGLAQSQNDAAAQNAAARQGFQYSNDQYLAGLEGSIGASAGQTTTGAASGAATTPGPNPFSQIAGGLVAGASFLANGGAVQGFAAGGSPFPGNEQIPVIAPVRAQGLATQPAALPPASAKPKGVAPNLGDIVKNDRNAMAGIGRGFNTLTGAASADPSSWATTVTPEGFAEGGAPDDAPDWYQAAVNKEASALADRPQDRLPAQPISLDPAPAALRGSVYPDPLPAMIDADDPAFAGSYAKPGAPVQSISDHTGQGLAYTPTATEAATLGVDGPAMDIPATPEKPAIGQTKGFLGLFPSLSDNQRQAVLTAGLGMMASKSHHFGTAVGEGGLEGAKTYTKLTEDQADRAIKQQNANLQAKELMERKRQFDAEQRLREAKSPVDIARAQADIRHLDQETKTGAFKTLTPGQTLLDTNNPAQVAEMGDQAKQTQKAIDFRAAEHGASTAATLDAKVLNDTEDRAGKARKIMELEKDAREIIGNDGPLLTGTVAGSPTYRLFEALNPLDQKKILAKQQRLTPILTEMGATIGQGLGRSVQAQRIGALTKPTADMQPSAFSDALGHVRDEAMRDVEDAAYARENGVKAYHNRITERAKEASANSKSMEKGSGTVSPVRAAPTPDQASLLLSNKNNPDAIAKFNKHFGAGAAEALIKKSRNQEADLWLM